jgi:hypothetical protein
MFSEIKQFSTKLEHLTSSSGSHIKSAMYHVEKAETISNIDPEMAIFRLITAEEEAATAILLTLKEHGYSNAKELNKNNHIHKQSLFPYICAIVELMKEDLNLVSGHPPELSWCDIDGVPALRLGIKIILDDMPLTVHMDPPLNFQRKNKDDNLQDFSRELITFLQKKGIDDMIKHLKENANLRNRLLYSDGKTIPNKLTDKSTNNFERKARWQLQKTNALIAIYFMIAPFKKMKKALFVEQALFGYLNVLNYIKGKRL